MARRVLWVIKGLGPGGAERLLTEAAAGLSEDGLDLTCAYVVPWKDHLVPELRASGVHTVCVGRRRGHLLWAARLARLVRRGGFDVVHVHAPLPGSVARLAARSMRRERRPLLLTTEHNSWQRYRLPTRLLNRSTSRWSRHTFAVSAETAGSITGSTARRLEVLTHGVDVRAIRERLRERGRLRAELGIDDAVVLLGTVANFREQKDYPTLLAAAAALVHRHVPFHLVAAGQGPLEGEIRALAADLGLEQHLQLLGYRADAVDVLAACDVFVLASKYEGLPVAVMESCALGLPAVLTDVGGMKATLGEDGAVFVPPGQPELLADALQAVVADERLRARLGAAAAAAAAHFDGSHAVDVLRHWYLHGAPPPEGDRTPAPLDGLCVREATADDLPAILDLCRRSLGWDERSDWDALYRWKHVTNPFGPSPTWIAVDGERIVALRAFMRWRFVQGGRTISAVRAVDTATDEEYRGRGLFTALTLGALPSLRRSGVQMVFNTPNGQSRPGYLKMGWRDVGTLHPVVRPVGVRSLWRMRKSRVPADQWPQPLALGRSVEEWLATDGIPVARKDARVSARVHTEVDEAFARWRFGATVQPCRVVGAGGDVAVVQLRRRGSVRELVCLASWGNVDRALVSAARECRADVVVRLGDQALRHGYVRLPSVGPKLTSRAVGDYTPPPLSGWALTMGDVALF